MNEMLTVATWNVNAIRGAGADRITRVADALARHAPDVVVLQEVATRTQVVEQLRDELLRVGLSHFLFSGSDIPRETKYGDKAYGNVLASRWPFEAHPWPVVAEWPQLTVAARMTEQFVGLLIVGTHIPNGTGNGWEKVYAFETLVHGLEAAERPVILAGDFNEPRLFDPTFTSFGATDRGGLRGTFTDLNGVTHDRERWQRAVAAVLDPARTAWGGRHVTTLASVEFEATHIARGIYGKQFDHILVSDDDFRVERVLYDHSVREGTPRLSDHSMVVVALEPRFSAAG